MAIGPVCKSFLFAVAALSILACNDGPPPKSSTRIVPVGQPPVGGIADFAEADVGIVVGFSVVADGPSQGTAVATVDDPSIVSLIPSSVPGTYVLIGIARGETVLHAAAGDADPVTMPVVVALQTASP